MAVDLKNTLDSMWIRCVRCICVMIIYVSTLHRYKIIEKLVSLHISGILGCLLLAQEGWIFWANLFSDSVRFYDNDKIWKYTSISYYSSISVSELRRPRAPWEIVPPQRRSLTEGPQYWLSWIYRIRKIDTLNSLSSLYILFSSIVCRNSWNLNAILDVYLRFLYIQTKKYNCVKSQRSRYSWNYKNWQS